ncbi:RNase P subunit p30-domain-containing protein [Dimargaris cristalligena]|uniref:RNase P subunit p30-domain-containing protein n=1 Tax=Dimargaris cristalligena TaxID=215637 RepID=A0A4P9ZZ70_9FUNG|nr:RNase P subunit p30-domain-containing protein [Dimargaris cristalligena]|eukprot:RKP39064.1 RNase P subunit p30-domain-containing protein [Dimargaris cristalligena]
MDRYDILAVQPMSQDALQLACESLEVDIIRLGDSDNVRWVRTASARLAISRGVHFELHYSQSLSDQVSRRRFISMALSIQENSKGQNIILTSGAQRAFNMRGPYDVMNMGHLFGLNRAWAKTALTTSPRAVLFHAETRRSTCKSTVMVKPMPTTDALSTKREAEENAMEVDAQTKKSKTAAQFFWA